MELILKNRGFKMASLNRLAPIYQIGLPTDVIGIVCDHLFMDIKKYQSWLKKKKDRALYDLGRTIDFSNVTNWTFPFDTVVYCMDWELKHGKYYWHNKFNVSMLQLRRSIEKYEEDSIYDEYDIESDFYSSTDSDSDDYF